MFYKGYPNRTEKGGYTVFRNDNAKVAELDPGPSQKIINHSPDGFSWGYADSGPAQLALALLLDVTGEPEIAQTFYQEFKQEIVASWPSDGEWSSEARVIELWLSKRSTERFSRVKNG